MAKRAPNVVSYSDDFYRKVLDVLEPVIPTENSDLGACIEELNKRVRQAKRLIAIEATNLEQLRKRNTIRFFGIREDPDEADLSEKVRKFVEDKLELDVYDHQIEYCYRTENPSSLKPRSVVVKFNDGAVVRNIFRAYNLLGLGDLPEFYLCQELCVERRVLRQVAVLEYGADRVAVVRNRVQVALPEGAKVVFSALTEFWDFLEEKD